jgi:hypothetical protein
VSVLVAAVAPVALLRQENVTDPIAIALAVVVVIAAVTALWFVWKNRPVHSVVALTIAAAFAWFNAFGYAAPRLDSLWMSPRIAATVRAAQSCPGAKLVTTPYGEPSLVFLYGRTRTHIADTGADAADALANAAPCGLALIGSEKRTDFLARAASLGLELTPVKRITGRNYSNGDDLDLILYRAVAGQSAQERGHP